MAKLFGFVALCVAFSLAESHFLSFLQPPKHDGVRRVTRLSRNNFTGQLVAAEAAILVVGDAQDFGDQRKCPSEVENFAELTAQMLNKKNIAIFGIPVGEFIAAQKDVQPQVGEVYIYKGGNRFPYFGQRTAPSLLSYFQRLNSSHVGIIGGRIDKIAFDNVQQVKVVGFFMQATADYDAFLEAAMQLSPRVAFYVVLDRTVAQHLKLDTVGQINLVKPFQKKPVSCPTNPAAAADIVNFISEHQGLVLNHLTEHNINDPQLVDGTRTTFVAVSDTATPVGNYFYKLLTKLVKQNSNSTDFQHLSIIWVDPQLFPAVHIMMEQLHETLGVPATLPAFGTVGVGGDQSGSAWFEMALLNTTGEKQVDEANLIVLEGWISGILNQTVNPNQAGVQWFSHQPKSQVLDDGSEVVLECSVQKMVGDCLWLKDGQNIGYNLARYPQYAWRADPLKGDCTLVITGAKQGRDDGEWVCQVTGDHDNPTITSVAAKVILNQPNPTAKTEL